jgi:tetratricopeptide (TPR) repeat protein
MLFSNADFSTGRLQLGDYYIQNNNVNSAIKHYEMALQKDNLLMPVYSNLATAYSLVNNFEKAKETLDSWILLEPDLSRPHFLKALLNFEMNKDEEAVADLIFAIKLNPNDTRSMYNLATYYFQDKKDLLLAEKYIKSALKVESRNQDYKYLLALIYRDQGKLMSSQKILQELGVDQQ